MHETCEAIFKMLRPIYMKVPSTQEEWKVIADEFLMKWNYPNCIGALDGKHVVRSLLFRSSIQSRMDVSQDDAVRTSFVYF